MKIELKEEIRKEFEEKKYNKMGVLVQILRDTFSYYNENPTSRRNKNEESCYYSPITDASEGCAVGRIITPECARFLDDQETCGITVGNEPYEWDKYILEHLVFFKMLQSFHDADINWNNEGLSDIGLGAKNMIQTYIFSQYGV